MYWPEQASRSSFLSFIDFSDFFLLYEFSSALLKICHLAALFIC